MAKAETMTEVLRRAIEESGESHLGLAKATGVVRSSIARFMDGETSIRLDRADALAAHLGLRLVQVGKGKRANR